MLDEAWPQINSVFKYFIIGFNLLIWVSQKVCLSKFSKSQIYLVTWVRIVVDRDNHSDRWCPLWIRQSFGSAAILQRQLPLHWNRCYFADIRISRMPCGVFWIPLLTGFGELYFTTGITYSIRMTFFMSCSIIIVHEYHIYMHGSRDRYLRLCLAISWWRETTEISNHPNTQPYSAIQ